MLADWQKELLYYRLTQVEAIDHASDEQIKKVGDLLLYVHSLPFKESEALVCDALDPNNNNDPLVRQVASHIQYVMHADQPVDY